MCIRDRYQRRVHGDKQFEIPKITMLKCITILALAVSAFSVNWKIFDRCNAEWVYLIQSGQLYDCAEQGAPSENLKVAGSVTTFSNVLATFGKTIDGQPATPKTLFLFLRSFKGSIQDIFRKFDLEGEILKNQKAINFEVLKKRVEDGYAVHVSSIDSFDNYLVQRDVGEAFETINSRGQVSVIRYAQITDAVTIKNLAKTSNSLFLA
eukprot:TRINITY_DN264_c0_g2_i6.p1 TRINITY_DN264_c0_g2~~TRINITY_DN264_c0_g2_i6.p1  ORF type:complete len:229 (+),score=69.36 TRINITY_DN264_c0_g2_i6:64-687(+)